MPWSDLELQKNALDTETRMATHSVKVRKAMVTANTEPPEVVLQRSVYSTT